MFRAFQNSKIVPLKRSITVLFAFLIDLYINENNLNLQYFLWSKEKNCAYT